MNTTILRLLALALVAGASSPRALGQSPISWELVGMVYENGTSPVSADRLVFVEGPSPDSDTLYIGSYAGIWKRLPGPAADILSKVNRNASASLIATSTGLVMGGGRAGVGRDGVRSADYGRTWQEEIITIPIRVNGLPAERGCGVVALLQSTLPALVGAVYAGCGPEVWRSFQRGAFHTWEVVGQPGGELRYFAELPVTSALPGGRLVAAMQGRISFSDDGGVTWTVGFNSSTIVENLSLAPDASHPYGGTLYAGGREFGRGPDPLGSVYASDDGAASWRRVHAFVAGEFLAYPGAVKVIVGPDSALYGGLYQVVGGNNPNLGTVVRSWDGGQTWEAAADGFGGWAVNAFALGRDGRLYLGADRGVWRTANPLVVAGEAGPDEAPGVGMSVRPNPAGGRVEVVLSLAEAGAVRVVVVDVLGREVAVVLDGAAAAGETLQAVDVSAWPAGVYVVRAEASGRVATARLVVAR